MHLNSAFFQKHWECMVFSDFINSKCTIDEIYFYMACRDMINHGLVLDNSKNCFEIVQRGDTKRTMEIIKKILSRFEDRDAQAIIEKLRNSSIIKSNGREYLDVGFVLKILLELYKADKKIRYTYMKKDLDLEENLSEMLPKHSTMAVELKPHEYLTSYENFRKYVDKHFPFLCETEKLQFFCDSYNVGGGEVTFDSMFTTVHEHGIFIKDLRVRYLSFENQEIVSHNSVPSAMADTNIAFLRRLKENQTNEYMLRDHLASKIEGLGIEKLAFDIKSLEGWLDGTKFGFGWKDIFLIYTKAMNYRSLVNTLALLSFKQEPDDQYLITLMKEQTTAYIGLVQPLVECKEQEAKLEEDRNLASTRLAKFVKNWLDKNQWYRLMQLILNLKESDANKPVSSLLQKKKTIKI